MEDIVEEPARKIPVAARVDILVLGGGPAGFAAAVCAARMGARTLLVEQTGALGGMATTGLMSHWTGSTRGGIYEEILDRSRDPGGERQTINPERLKTILLDMLLESGSALHLHTLACEPVMGAGKTGDGDHIRGVITESKSGREALLARVVIDATGDGDIAAKAGVPYRKGRETDGKMQPMTLMFKVGGVDTAKAVFPGGFEDDYEVPKGSLQQLGRKHLPPPAGHVLLYRSSLPGVVTCNMTNSIAVDGTNAVDLTKAEIECRKQLGPIVAFLREYTPGFENCHLLESADYVGVRETRHFEGEYTLTEKDILEARVFDDWAVTKAHFNFDIHNLAGSGLDPTGVQKHFPQQNGYTIPYRCFVPMKVENLLLAGRNISGTHAAHSNYRVMPICANMGQAVGCAAALCVQKGITPRKLDVAELQEVLRRGGVMP
jgi:ribulose 1,5-bisphosphate synthetase/thiazole synthase